MDDFEGSVMVALLPITDDWCQIELPHLTLVYAGEVKDLEPTDFNKLAKDAASLSMLSAPVFLRVTGVETFGDTDPVSVLRLQPSPELLAMRHAVEGWNASEYTEFKPHCTIGPVGTYIENRPTHLAFDRIMVGWGEDRITFWLRR
jgi:2'-5' RNA ligase